MNRDAHGRFTTAQHADALAAERLLERAVAEAVRAAPGRCRMSEWTDADVERAAWVLNAVDWPDGMGDDAYSREQARALLASGVVKPARVVEEAERERDRAVAKAEDYEGRYETSHASRMHAEDCYHRTEADLSRLRSAVEALADDIRRQSRICNVGNTATIADRLAALLTEGRDRAGEGAGS